ncbi:hypothetical protein L4C38_06960 [Vibrio kasasachensis]|uniref:hypothetical protein n=1 Tax=Vibrio kasasachensis TaxID=2910248 RepID=UPI003D1245FB
MDYFYKKGSFDNAIAVLVMNENSVVISELVISKVPPEFARFSDMSIVDIRELTTFFINESGDKFVCEFSGYQQIQCQFDDELLFTDGKWKVKTSRYKYIEQEKEWQRMELTKVDRSIFNYRQDQSIPEIYSELRITSYSEADYYALLSDRKLLIDYVIQVDFPECGRPILSGLASS